MLIVSPTQIHNGRIIIDPNTFNVHTMAGPSLESINTNLWIDIPNEGGTTGTHNVIYEATNNDFQAYQIYLKEYEDQQGGASC